MQKKQANINIWDEQWELGMLNTRTGADISASAQIRSKNYIEVKPSTQYYFYSGKNSQWVMFYDQDKNVISVDDYPVSEWTSRSYNAYGATRNTVFTTPQICHYIRFYCTTGYGNTYLNNISFNYPSTDHEYHKHI